MDEDLRNQFQRDGYLIIENFLTEYECGELLDAGLALTEDLMTSQQRSVFSTTEPDKQQLVDSYFLQSNDKICQFFEKDALNSDGTLKVDSSVALNKVGHALHILHPTFRKYTYCDQVKSVCIQLGLIEPSVVQSMYIYKNPGVGGEVVPHQDATYLYTEPVPPVGFWIALEDATMQNGCLWVAKGSHTSGVHKRLIKRPGNISSPALIYDMISVSNYENTNFISLPVRKGTCIILHGLVVHKSAHNRSDKSRNAYTFHVIEKHNNHYSDQNWLIEGPNAPFLPLYTTSPY